ncbi:MAG: M20/M25/M40 family metallo-hydrolase [Oscillospiraceae bacterium]|jgi:tripeptide aminopeptidase|nr:M20/M25/M40 family metallo-hydrolase [Oscillospiraceae bacterium]
METNRLWETFRRLAEIYSPSLGERAFCGALRRELEERGCACAEDGAGAAIGGTCGNLYAFAPGDLPLPPLLFSAHMDTVEPAEDKRAVLREDGRIVPEGDTILGADDAAGIAVLLEALIRLRETGAPHRPLELLFPAAEELYGLGSAAADYGLLRAREAYVLDLGGKIGEAANAAPSILAFTVTLRGKAAHAGFAPEEGIHAISAAAKAIARLPLGTPRPGVTCNIGTIAGGTAGNIVPALCVARGEIRSLSHRAAEMQWAEVREIFLREARAAGAEADFEARWEITAYETPPDSLVVRRFRAACEAVGVPCRVGPTLGGSDNNNFACHGIQGLVIACAMYEVHSTREYSSLDELEQCVRLVLHLMTEDTVL